MEKIGPEMKEYPFWKETEDLLKFLILGGETTRQILEEGEIGTPRGNPMEEEVTNGLSPPWSPLLNPNATTQVLVTPIKSTSPTKETCRDSNKREPTKITLWGNMTPKKTKLEMLEDGTIILEVERS